MTVLPRDPKASPSPMESSSSPCLQRVIDFVEASFVRLQSLTYVFFLVSHINIQSLKYPESLPSGTFS